MRLRLVAGLLGALAVASLAVASEEVVAIATTSSDVRAIPDGQVTVIGVAGLRWSDLAENVPPALAETARKSARAALAVRATGSYTCPADGWLTLNAGVRVAAERPDGECAALPTPIVVDGATTVPGWTRLVDTRTRRDPAPVWSTLAGQRVAGPQATAAQWAARAGTKCAVGPGAALAFADRDGAVIARYSATLATVAPQCELVVLDAGVIPEGAGRRAALGILDRAVAEASSARPEATLVVAGIADGGTTAGLTAVMVRRPELAAQREFCFGCDGVALYSGSTRQDGLVQLADLTTSLLTSDEARDLPGAVLSESGRRAEFADLLAWETSARVLQDGFVAFFVVFIGGPALALLAIALALRGPARRPAIRIVGLVFGAVPAASFLVNLLPWARWEHPAAIRWTATAVSAIVLGTVAAAGPWRRSAYGSPAVLAAATMGVMAVDVGLLGSRLQLGAPFGLSVLVAGRFYGFGNIAFAVFAVCALLVATAVWVRTHSRIAVLGVAAVAIVVDGAPGLGTDFGGVLALAPGLALLGLLLTGTRLSVARLALVAAGTAVLVAALAGADWLRPAQSRSHLGRFVQDVLDGNGLATIGRKADANLTLFSNPLIVAAAIPLTVVVVVAVTHPHLLRLHGFARAQQADPAFQALVRATLATALLGFAVNDSGVIVPAVALFVAVPLFLAVWAAQPPSVRPPDRVASARS
ncbi:MAG: hypothetical protein ACT4QG_01360 [Sporichthyaceae bacterium]